MQTPVTDDENRRLSMIRSLGLPAAQDPSLQALAKLAADLLGVETAMVSVIESEQVCIAAAFGYDGEALDRRQSFCGHVLDNPSQVLWVEDAAQDPRLSDSQYVVGAPYVRFYAGAPLKVNGCMVGVLCALGPQPRPRNAHQVRILEGVARACEAELAERHRTHAMRHALNASADALIDCDADGKVCGWSEGAEKIFGYTSDEAMGQEVTLIIPPEHWENHRRGVSRWRASGAARLGRRLELPAQRRDGSTLDIELWMSVSHDGGEARIHANIRDISERRAQTRALAEARARAEDANRAKTAFLANMSHELRTPLNGVTACAGLLAAGALKEDQRRLVEIIGGAADQLSGLIADLLDIARIESGELRLDPTPVHLGELVDGLAALARLKADEKGIPLRVEVAAKAASWVMVDAARMKQVLSNLLSNAIKFTSVGEVVLTVDRQGDDYRLEVSDTGIGFDPEEQGLIFGRFQQADPTITRRFGGTGLGLSICRELIEAMGGRLDCHSEPGRGSRFWIDLQLPPAEAEADGLRQLEDAPTETLNGLHVLVVDDHATNRQVVSLILESAGISSTSASNGREALEALADRDFDLILMDMMMPEMDGVEATRRIRMGEVGAAAAWAPIIMLTANSLPEHIEQSLEAGASGHLAKPINPAVLLDCVARCLEAHPVQTMPAAQAVAVA